MLPQIFLIGYLLFVSSITTQDSLNVQTHSISDYHVVSHATIASNLLRIQNLMMDTTAYTQWLHFCNEANLIEEISDTKWLFEFIYDVDNDWLDDRYLFAEVNLRKDNANSRLLFDLTLPHKNLSKRRIPKNVKKVKDFKIHWEFTQVNDSVKIHYDLKLNPALPLLIRTKNNKKKVNTYLIELSKQTINKLTKRVKS